MKKLILIIIAMLSTGLYILSSNNNFMFKILNIRGQLNSSLGTDRLKYGDLYRMCFLSQFKDEDRLIKAEYPQKANTSKRNINLYTLCNSYLLSFVHNQQIFSGVKKFWSARAHTPRKPPLDTTEKNILLLQMSERSVKYFMNSKGVISNFAPVHTTDGSDTLPVFTLPPDVPKYPLMAQIFNPRLQESLEFNLFDYRFITPLKELKASINYNIFDRVGEGVVVSPDGKHLFLASTVDPNSEISSFTPISNSTVDTLVSSLNTIYNHYKNFGFDEVYLTIIPNRVTLLAPEMGTYNNLLPRIQNHPNLEIPYIDIYEKFKKEPRPVFQRADTHWNYYGFKLWVNEFNKLLSLH